MNIVIRRSAGWYGKLVPVELLCNGRRVGLLKESEELLLTLEATDLPAKLQVKMQNVVGSPVLTVERLSGGLYLECGANLWTLFDFLNLALISGLRDKVFYLQKARMS